jgi:ubiquinone/menaquinone biosynthesis C-methylase UbiE
MGAVPASATWARLSSDRTSGGDSRNVGSQSSIYDFPDVYDAVLRAPPEQTAAEVETIRRVLAERNITQGRVLELACGTCVHGILLAQGGFSVTGVDISEKMLESAWTQAESAGIVVKLICDDVVDFNLDSESFDCAIFMAETFPLITEYSDLLTHFRAVGRHLRRGGIYIVDVDAHKHGVGTSCHVWGERSVPLDKGWVEVWHEDLPGDWVSGTSHLIMHCRIHVDGTIYETADDWRIRQDSPWHLSVLARTLQGWALAGFVSWRDPLQDISEEEHYFMVLERL